MGIQLTDMSGSPPIPLHTFIRTPTANLLDGGETYKITSSRRTFQQESVTLPF